jgi:hypothetical protein
MASGRQVDDRQPAKTQRDPGRRIHPIARIIRAAARNRVHHAPDDGPSGLVQRALANKSRYAAH